MRTSLMKGAESSIIFLELLQLSKTTSKCASSVVSILFVLFQ